MSIIWPCCRVVAKEGLYARPETDLPVHHQMCAVTPYPSRLVLEVGGTKRSCAPSDLQAGAVVIDAAKLPNPYTPISKGVLPLSAPAIVEWMMVKDQRASGNMEKMVACAQDAFASQRSVRVQCFGGAHRSQAVAWKIITSLNAETVARVHVVCLDHHALPELVPYVS